MSSMYGIMNFISPMTKEEAPAPKRVDIEMDRAESVSFDRPQGQVKTKASVEDLKKMGSSKNIRDISTLSKGDRIIDNMGNERYVVAVDNGKVIMTGKNKHIEDYKKVFTWSESKFQDAVYSRGFRLSR